MCDRRTYGHRTTAKTALCRALRGQKRENMPETTELKMQLVTLYTQSIKAYGVPAKTQTKVILFWG